eukprot:2502770-Ditylum_brightwellii.AAC.1
MRQGGFSSLNCRAAHKRSRKDSMIVHTSSLHTLLTPYASRSAAIAKLQLNATTSQRSHPSSS